MDQRRCSNGLGAAQPLDRFKKSLLSNCDPTIRIVSCSQFGSTDFNISSAITPIPGVTPDKYPTTDGSCLAAIGKKYSRDLSTNSENRVLKERHSGSNEFNKSNIS